MENSSPAENNIFNSYSYAEINFNDGLSNSFDSNSKPSTSNEIPCAPRVKRKRVVLSLQQKIEILNKLDNGGKAKAIAQEYNIGISSLKDIQSKKDSILKYVSSFESEDAMKRRKTMRNSINKELDDKVYEWYIEMQKKGEFVSGRDICQKAFELNSTIYGSPDFKASEGWLKNFRSRHGLDVNATNQNFNLNCNNNYIKTDVVESPENSFESFAMQALPQKRKRVVLSLKQKIDIIKKLNEGASVSHLAREYNIGTSSVGDIKAKQASILKFVSCFESMEVMDRRKTMKQAYNKSLDEAVYNWYLETQYNGQTLSGPAICEKALEMNKSMGGSSDFKASNGWLNNFKSRHGLDFKVIGNKCDELYEDPKSPEDWTLNLSNVDVSCEDAHSVEGDVIQSPSDKFSGIDYSELLQSFDFVLHWASKFDENKLDLSNLTKLREMAYEKAMSVAFSSEDSAPIGRVIECSSNEQRPESVPLDDMHEIEKCANWIKNKGFSKVALQFPDSLLGDAASVALKLEDLTNKEIFILGDTSYGSCCVDEVAAEHVSADAIIHFGHACLSPTKRLPVLYIFGKHHIDINDTVDSFQSLFPDEKTPVVILYEVTYSHAISIFVEHLKNYDNVVTSQLEIPGEDVKLINQDKAFSNLIAKNHRHILIPDSHTIDNYSIFYVGSRSVTLTNLMLSFPNCTFYSYNPIQKIGKVESLDVNRHLKRRYYYIEKAKDAKIIGILVGTLGVSNYLSTINHIKELIKNAGKKSYTLVVGKLNSAKLANFPEIDVFVYVACIESSLVESRDFYQPIVTPYELEIALNQAREWTGDYITDFSEILPGAAHYVPLCKSYENTDVSLVTGRLRHTELSTNTGISESSETAVASRDKMEISSIHSKGAGEFLLQRSWQGLEQKLGETSSANIEEGQRGIASIYEDEVTD
ncbi:2-(3-amino-3-carboxypropyl)histidine synthase subunit 2 [Parasteatoda tepidariorum]|uniref:2-(3-amino-3-carboxypropyl)histidine synthase subunit 2 n=1 Tax=Parasteatoda tepidariorum TaxID=114398 RepID=UPI00077FDF60|nr:2-(3-amino-3-carboxypropyl)histidine synthase subunit 2 [Parasteatoda tepidariorum]